MATTRTTSTRGPQRRALSILTTAALLALGSLAVIAAAPGAPTARAAGSSPASSGYGWPVKPFDRQHPIRGFFGDPRVGEGAHGHSKSFHFGVDISAPDGTAVFATTSGRVVWEPERPQTIAIRAADGTVFSYWHIVPAIRNGASATAYRTLLGHVAKGWEHVHFAEFDHGRHLNPLRPGALSPYRDTTRPSVHRFSFERNGKPIRRTRLAGRFDLVAELEDQTPVPVPGRWSGMPVMPAIVKWRLVGPKHIAGEWRTAVDFSSTIPHAGQFDVVYARWTRQNHPRQPGRFRLNLARDWDSRTGFNGSHLLEVVVIDTRGNRSVSSARFSVRNERTTGS
jgi:hypothetical protein